MVSFIRNYFSKAFFTSKNRICLFPGQGSQEVGMGQDLVKAYPKIADSVFGEVNEALKVDLLKIMLNGPKPQSLNFFVQETLTNTKYAQPAILAYSIGLFRLYESILGQSPMQGCKFVAGHSLGEYTALCASESLSLKDAAVLVYQRGQLMDSTISQPLNYGMTALLLKKSQFDKTMNILKDKLAKTSIANINGTYQIVLSGCKEEIDKISSHLKKEGCLMKGMKLEVSAPFHSFYMQPVADEMRDLLAKIQLSKPKVPLLSNVHAKPVIEPEEIKEFLIKQTTSPVQWLNIMQVCAKEEECEIVTFGPGHVLAGLFRKEFPSANVRNYSNVEELAPQVKR